MNIIDEVAAKLAKFSDSKIIIAVSGGSDSVALAYLVKKISQFNFKAIIIDHHLRESSAIEAKKAQEILDKLNIESEIISLAKQNIPKSNIEAWAREKRYEALASYAKKHNYAAILLAHHFDDLIENFFIRLSRGSGVDGLSSLADQVELNGTIYFRPLLDYKKKDLQQILVKEKINWVEDISNQDERFLRNKIRIILDQFMDDHLLEQRIAQTSKHLERASDFLIKHTEEIMKEKLISNGDSYNILWSEFKSLHEEIALRLLINILGKINGSFYKPRFVKLYNLYKKLIKLDFNKSITFNHCLIKSEKINNKQYLAFYPEYSS